MPFSLDDFGVGYSSLSYLARLPIEQIKIDRSFVTDVEQGRHKAAIVVTLMTLGQHLGYAVVAEGVETAAELAVPRALVSAFSGTSIRQAATGSGISRVLRAGTAALTGVLGHRQMGWIRSVLRRCDALITVARSFGTRSDKAGEIGTLSHGISSM